MRNKSGKPSVSIIKVKNNFSYEADIKAGGRIHTLIEKLNHFTTGRSSLNHQYFQ